MIIANSPHLQTPQFRVLSDHQCREIFLAALECLNRIGVQVHHGGARDLLSQSGAVVEGNVVRIPPHLVQQAIATTPRTFSLWSRDGAAALQVAPDRVHFGPGPTCTYFIDVETGARRKARRGDAALTARVVDALPNISYAMSLSIFDDVTPVLSPVYEFAEMIAHTTKPVIAWANSPDTLDDIYRIAMAAAGGEAALRRKPSFAFFASYESPLRLIESATANLLRAAELGLPIVWIGGPTVGLESPFTGASALALHLAAALAGLTLAQLKRAGVPVVIAAVPGSMDLRSARPAYGSPELVLNSAAAADLARYLGLPFMGTAGASESKVLDAQAAAEVSLQVMVSALSGAALVHDAGFLDCADIGSLPLLVLVDEIIGMTARVMRGVDVRAESLLLDLIEQVGPGGHFMAEQRSVSMMRREVWLPTLIDRRPYLEWEEKGSKTMETRVWEKLTRILRTHQPLPLEAGAAEEIDRILEAAEKRERRHA